MAWEGAQCCDGRNTAIGAMLCWVQRCSQGATLQKWCNALKKGATTQGGCGTPGRVQCRGGGVAPCSGGAAPCSGVPCSRCHSPTGKEVTGQGQVGAVPESGAELSWGVCGQKGRDKGGDKGRTTPSCHTHGPTFGCKKGGK